MTIDGSPTASRRPWPTAPAILPRAWKTRSSRRFATTGAKQAGGVASTGRERVMELQPASLHQRAPLILGSRNEVERIERYHRDHADGQDQGGRDSQFDDSLFNSRSLFRIP